MRARRWEQTGLRVPVAEVQADRGGLEHDALVVLDRRDPAQRMPTSMVRAAALLAGHHDQLVGLTELLEHPQHAQRTPGPLAVKDPHHGRDNTR